MSADLISALRNAGGLLANVAYNLAQKPGHALTSDDVALLDKLRREWDEALRAALAAAPEQAEPVGWITDESLHSLRVWGGNGSRCTVPLHAKQSKVAKSPLYAAAPAPAPIAQPQPLTDEQIDHHWRAAYSEGAYRAGSFDWFAAGWRKAEAFFGIGAQEQP